MSATSTRTEPRGARRPDTSRRRTIIAGMALLLAAVAFFLLPTAHLNTQSLVRVNGVVRIVPPDTKVAGLAGIEGLQTGPGSTLDLTGDVTALGAGTPAERSTLFVVCLSIAIADISTPAPT